MTDTSAPDTLPAKSAAEVLYGTPPAPPTDSAAPDAVKELRAVDSARSLYSPQTTYARDLPDGTIDGLDHSAAREVLADVGASPDDAAQLVALVHGLPQTTEAQRDAWAEQTAQLGFTANDMQAARALVARDPRVAEFIRAHGLESHPGLTQRLVELGRAARLR